MKKRILSFGLPALLILCLVTTSQAQRRKAYGRFEDVDGFSITVKTGLTQAFGELNTPKRQTLYGVDINRGLTPNISLKLAFETGNLEGEMKSYYNSRFRTDFYQLNLMAILNVGKLIDEDLPFNWTVGAGLGTIGYNAIAYDLTSGAIQRYTSLGTTNGRRTQWFAKYGKGVGEYGIYYTRERTVPLSMAVSYPIGNAINLGLEFRYNFVRNDKLDATSGYDRSDVSKGQAPRLWGSLSYSDTPNDQWAYGAVYLTYKLGSNRREYQRGI